MSAHERMNEHYRATLDKVQADTGIKAGSTISWRLLREVAQATVSWIMSGYTDHAERIEKLEQRLSDMEGKR